VDQAATTPYTLFVYGTELHAFDGITKTARPLPFLIRHSAGSSFPVDWAAAANLRPTSGTGSRPVPGAIASAEAAARAHTEDQQRLGTEEQGRWVAQARSDLDGLEARVLRQLSD